MDSWMGVGRSWVPWRFRSVRALNTQLLDIGYMSERFWCWRHHKKNGMARMEDEETGPCSGPWLTSW
jgi:hypothetical protein